MRSETIENEKRKKGLIKTDVLRVAFYHPFNKPPFVRLVCLSGGVVSPWPFLRGFE